MRSTSQSAAYPRVIAFIAATTVILALDTFAIATGISSNYIRGLQSGWIVIGIAAAASLFLPAFRGPKLLDDLESWFERRWREQAETETYEPLSTRARATLKRLSTLEGLHRA